MLSNEEIAEYKRLKKDVDEANVEKQTMKAEIKVFVQQGKEKLAKYGFESYSDIPKLKDMLDELEEKVRKEKEEMLEYCSYMANKKAEKMTLFVGD
jgi:seryl-tRNA synthetase